MTTERPRRGLRSRLHLHPPRGLRTRLALFAALAAFGCLTVAGVVVFVAAARLLGRNAEAQLRQVASVAVPVANLPTSGVLEAFCTSLATQRPDDASTALGAGSRLPANEVIVELVRPDGTSCQALGSTGVHQLAMPSWGMRRLIGTDLPQGRGDHGEHLLVLQERLPNGWQLWIARDLSRDLDVVFELRGVMFGLSVVGGLVALGAGWMIARSGLRPVASLAEAAEHIARTEDLSVRIDVPDRGDRDEVTRLARAFDRMTSALAASRDRQSQLVADAGHELRTPLTSLRTNIDLLLLSERSGRALPPGQREALFEDVRSQLAELSQLAGELTVLAQDEPARALGPARLDRIVSDAVRRVRPRAGDRVVDVATEPWELTDADVPGLARAVVNVLDNAVKFSPPGSTVRVRQAAGTVTVDDEGPGVPPQDRAEAFARFWRSEQARALPGSGLGLAIVNDVVSRHGGSARIEEAPGGGARVVLDLPGHAVAHDGDAQQAGDPHTTRAARVVET